MHICLLRELHLADVTLVHLALVTLMSFLKLIFDMCVQSTMLSTFQSISHRNLGTVCLLVSVEATIDLSVLTTVVVCISTAIV